MRVVVAVVRMKPLVFLVLEAQEAVVQEMRTPLSLLLVLQTRVAVAVAVVQMVVRLALVVLVVQVS